MGFASQLIRNIRKSLKDLFRKKKTKKQLRAEEDEVPEKWSQPTKKSKAGQANKNVILKPGKKRIPGLLFFKRALAGILLLINGVFSQFLLGTIGNQAQPLFIFFLANCFILADYLWKTRRQSE